LYIDKHNIISIYLVDKSEVGILEIALDIIYPLTVIKLNYRTNRQICNYR